MGGVVRWRFGKSGILLPASFAAKVLPVAQWQSSGLLIRGLSVRIRPGRPVFVRLWAGRVRSSVGKSVRLITARSVVRTHPGPPVSDGQSLAHGLPVFHFTIFELSVLTEKEVIAKMYSS